MKLKSKIKDILKLFKKEYVLVTILVIAALLRFIAVKPGYNQYHGDETAIWGAALDMVRKSTYDPGRYDYPATTMTINAVAFNLIFMPISWASFYFTNIGEFINGNLNFPLDTLEINRILEPYIIGVRGVNAIFWARYVTAFFGLGTVILTYILGKKMFSKIVGLIAALFLAFNYKNVMNSHLSLPDIYNAFFVLAALISSWDLIKKPSSRNYFVAGIMAGISFSVKYQFFGVIPFAFSHIYIWVKNKFNLKILFNPSFILAGFLIPVIFVVTNPFFLLNLESMRPELEYEFLKYGMGSNLLNYYPLSYLYHIDMGPILFTFVIVGIIWALFKDAFKALLILSVVVPSYWMFIYYSAGGFYIRNFIPTTPLLLMFASYAVYQVFHPLIKKFKDNYKFLIMLPCLLIITYIPARNSIISSYEYTKPWGYEILKLWTDENLPKDAVVGISYFDSSELEIRNEVIDTDLTKAYGLAEEIEAGADYSIINLNWASAPFYSWMNYNPTEVKEFWSKPLNTLRNTYYGLAAEELFRYQIYTVTKPWQSPDTHFVVVKSPQWPNVYMNQIVHFTFDKDPDWSVFGVRDALWERSERYGFDQNVGRIRKGSLVSYRVGSKFATERATSEAIPVKPGHLYRIEGFLKTDIPIEEENKNAFLRLDFWRNEDDFESLGIQTSVSSRLYGDGGWVKKTITDIAPQDANFLTVSFQSNAAISEVWFDDLSIFESKNVVENILLEPPYTNDVIDLNNLYPNSHGNL